MSVGSVDFTSGLHASSVNEQVAELEQKVAAAATKVIIRDTPLGFSAQGCWYTAQQSENELVNRHLRGLELCMGQLAPEAIEGSRLLSKVHRAMQNCLKFPVSGLCTTGLSEDTRLYLMAKVEGLGDHQRLDEMIWKAFVDGHEKALEDLLWSRERPSNNVLTFQRISFLPLAEAIKRGMSWLSTDLICDAKEVNPSVRQGKGAATWTMLHLAARWDHWSALDDLLAAGVDPDVLSSDDRTALMVAAEHNSVVAARGLFYYNHVADSEFEWKGSSTPLLEAFSNNSDEMVKLLTENDAGLVLPLHSETEEQAHWVKVAKQRVSEGGDYTNWVEMRDLLLKLGSMEGVTRQGCLRVVFNLDTVELKSNEVEEWWDAVKAGFVQNLPTMTPLQFLMALQVEGLSRLMLEELPNLNDQQTLYVLDHFQDRWKQRCLDYDGGRETIRFEYAQREWRALRAPLSNCNFWRLMTVCQNLDPQLWWNTGAWDLLVAKAEDLPTDVKPSFEGRKEALQDLLYAAENQQANSPDTSFIDQLVAIADELLREIEPMEEALAWLGKKSGPMAGAAWYNAPEPPFNRPSQRVREFRNWLQEFKKDVRYYTRRAQDLVPTPGDNPGPFKRPRVA